MNVLKRFRTSQVLKDEYFLEIPRSNKGRIQVTNATFRSWFINWLKTWFGVSKLSLFLGLLFSSFSTKLIYSSVMVSKFVFLGIYWRTKPLRFSFAPLSQLW